MRKAGAVLGLLLLLTSCSPPSPVIRASFGGGKVVFQAFQSDGGWFSSTESPTHLRVDRLVIYARDGASWVIERRRDGACGGNEASTFPLSYGQVPDCFIERLRAAPLRPGILYRIATDRGPFAEGFFRIVQTIEEPKWEAAYKEAESWPEETNPNTMFPAEPPVYDPPPADTNLLSANTILETPPE